ncbi:MAG: hypothetical protein AUK48_05490 [Oscillatoriales cyanobacterium CG2_30_44_21]|nr:MAG: hypothetical protein AUK48_05490 [Oscillatoriales cyanobacterium CG2_30_44_21]
MHYFVSSALSSIALLLTANLPQPVIAQAPPIRAYQQKATDDARKAQVLDQQQKSAPTRFDLQQYPISDRHLTHWQESLWAIGVLAPEKEYALQALENVMRLATANNLSDPQKAIIDTAFQVGHQLYTLKPAVYSKLRQQFLRTINDSTDPMWVAIALSALSKAPIYPELKPNSGRTGDRSQQATQINKLTQKVKQKFPNWAQDPHLKTTFQTINQNINNGKNLDLSRASLPSLKDLLAWEIAPQQAQMYVFCRPNRDVLCLSVLKDGNGKFVQQGKQLWSAPLLLQSIHNLDWNFTNGRTPQGIYRMEGVSRQPDDEYFHAYGQFSLVNLFVPFESGVTAFLPKQKGRFTGNLEAYQALLPASWRNYAPIQQTYWAGNMGRSLFRIHGSGAAINFFSNKSAVVSNQNFDWNATLGCLSALEIYDDRGSLLKSDMPKILDALQKVGRGKVEGYLVVVDIPSDADQPVTKEEIMKYSLLRL